MAAAMREVALAATGRQVACRSSKRRHWSSRRSSRCRPAHAHRHRGIVVGRATISPADNPDQCALARAVNAKKRPARVALATVEPRLASAHRRCRVVLVAVASFGALGHGRHGHMLCLVDESVPQPATTSGVPALCQVSSLGWSSISIAAYSLMPRGAIYRFLTRHRDAERKHLRIASRSQFGFGAWKMNVLVDHFPH